MDHQPLSRLDARDDECSPLADLLGTVHGVWALSEKGVALVESMLKDSSGNFVDHLRAMPDAGEDSDFDR